MENEKKYTEGTRLSEVQMSTLALHSFLKAGFKTIGDILAVDIEKIYEIRGVGQLTVSRLQLELAEHGIKWNTERLRTGRTIGSCVTTQTLISALGVDIRIVNALESIGCVRVGQMLDLTYDEAMSVKGLSDKSIIYLKNTLANHGVFWNIATASEERRNSILISIPKNRIHDGLCSVDFIYNVNTESVNIIKVR